MEFSRLYIGVITLIFAFLIMFNITGSNNSAIGMPSYVRVPIALAMAFWGIRFAFSKTSRKTDTSSGPKSMGAAIALFIGWIIVTLIILARLDTILS